MGIGKSGHVANFRINAAPTYLKKQNLCLLVCVFWSFVVMFVSGCQKKILLAKQSGSVSTARIDSKME